MKEESRILIIGAGEAGEMLLNEYNRRGRASSITGFIDDDINKKDKIISGKPVLGPFGNINVIISNHRINQVIIAMPSVDRKKINSIVTDIISSDPLINIYILPSIEKYFTSVPLAPALLDVAFPDIIDRQEVNIDVESINKTFVDKSILITGAGGSIGSEICRQLLKFRIKKLIASGRGEFSIYSLINSLDDYLKFMDYRPEIQYRIADVKDFAAMEKIFKEYKPDIVFHAAAHKHVPLMEFNETEAIKNNVLGTWNILKLCHKYSVAEFILISTDKAVKPVNIMGATKRVAELITQFYHREKKLKTSIVRFGNVIGSRGSVIPLFREQIEKGGPVTITHPEIKRYFMSIPEASLLVVNAAAYSAGGDLFILDMGGQYRIQDIAKKLIIHYGYKPDVDIKIEYTGLRPGEKMNEELYYDMENLKKTGNEKIFVLSIPDNIKAEKRLIKYLTKKLKYIDEFTPDDAREMLKNAIPEFKS